MQMAVVVVNWSSSQGDHCDKQGAHVFWTDLQAHDLKMALLVPSSLTTWNAHLLNNLTVSAMAPAEEVLFPEFARDAIRMEDEKNSSETSSPQARSSLCLAGRTCG